MYVAPPYMFFLQLPVNVRSLQNHRLVTDLVVHWFRIGLAMQGTQV